MRTGYLALNKVSVPPPLWLENTVKREMLHPGRDTTIRGSAAVLACHQPITDYVGADKTTYNP